MKTTAINIVATTKLLLTGILLMLSGVFATQAQPVVRANTAGPLNLTTAWTNNVAPASGDIAQWDSTVATAANTTAALGVDTTWAGINIFNPAATVVISAGNTLTLGSSGVNMSGASANLTFSSGLTLGSPQTWTVPSGRTLTVNGASLNAGANALTITGAGTEAIAAATAITATGGFTKNGSGPLTITGQATPTTSITTLTVNGGIGTISSGGAANSLNNTANIVVGGGTFNYQYNSAVNQAVAGLTINAGEGGAVASRNGSFNQGLTFTGTVTRNLGGTIYSKLLDGGRGFTIFNNLTASTIAKDANGTPFMTTGNAYSGATTDIYNDWGGVNSGHQVVVATYTTTTASSVGTSAQNGNVGTGIDTTLAANATSTSFRDGVNSARFVDLHGFTWQTGGILVNAAVATAGSSIKDTVGGGSLTGPANGDIVMMIDANLTTPQPFTISANIVNNTSTAITKGAPGTLILSGNNTFTGGVFLNDGTLQVGSAGALNSTTPNAINFDGNGLIGIQNTGLGPNPVAPVLALAGNSVAVASLSTANNLSGVVPVIKNANGSSVANAILTISGGSTTTFTGTIQDGTGGGTLGLNENGAGTQTIGGTLSYSGPTTVSAGTLALASTPSATPSYTVNGTLDVTALSGSNLTLGSQTLSGTGTVNGTVTTASGSVLAPGSGTATTGGSGTNTMSNLTLAGGSAVNYGLSVADPNNSQISVGAGTLTLPASGTVTLNLYTPGTSTPFAAAGTYNLFKFTSGVNTNNLASRFAIGTSITGFLPTFGTVAGPGGTTYLTLTLAANTGVIATWNPTPDADGNWSAGANWSSNPNVPHAAGDAGTLGVAAGLRTVTLDANETVGTLAMTNANSFVIANSGNTLTFDNVGVGASLTVSAGTQNAINTAVALNDNTATTVSGGASLTVAGSITNSPGANDALTINGAGTTILSAANSYGPLTGTNGTTLSGGGTLQVGNSASLGAGDLSVAGSSTLQAGAASLSLANNISVGGGVTATVDNNGYNFALAGVISGGGNLLQVGTGTLTLGSANTYAGSTRINAGTLSISGDGSLGTAPGSVTLNSIVLNGGDLLGSANATLNANRGVGIGATVGATPGTALIDAASGQTLAVNGIIQTAGNSGANNLTVNSLAPSPGTVVLGGANTFNGTTIIANGTLELSNSLALQNSTLNYNTGTLTFGGNLTAATIAQFTGSQNLTLNNQAATPAGVTLTTGGNNATWTNANSLSGLGGLTKVGTGNLILSGANSYSGGTTVNGGTLTLTNGGVINGSFVSPLTGNLVVNGGTLTSSAGSTVGTTSSGQSIQVLSGNVAYNGGISAAIADGQTISVLGGTFSASSVSIGRTAAYATAPTVLAPIAANQNDGFYVNGGTATLGGLIIGSAGANSSGSGRIDSGNVTVTNQFLLGDTTSTTRYSILQVNGGTLTSLDTVSGIMINRNNGANLNLAELYLSGGVTTANLITFGTNSDTVNNTGFLIINGGTLYLGSGGIVKGHAADTVTIGLTNGLIGATADWSSPLAMQLNGTNFNIQAADPSGTAHNITLTGVVSGTGGLTKTGNGTLTLNSAGNAYSGITAINAGTLNINSEWALGGANYGGLSFSNGTLQYAASLLNSATDVSTKPVSFITNAIIDVNGNNVSYANSIGNNGAGGLTIESSTSGGVLNLNGTNTYTGNTTVASGATLGGIGSIGGAVEIQSGAKLAPGNNGVGTLTNGSLTLDSGMVGNFEFNGVANDEVVVTNALILNDPSDNVAFNLYQAGGTLGMTQPGTYNLIQYAGSGPNLGSSWTTASGSNPHVANPQASFLYQFHATGGYLVLKVTLSGSVVSGTWTNDADGNWTTAADWDSNPTVPHSPGDLATLGTGSALRTVTLDANEDIGTLTLNNNNSFVIADNGNTLTLDNNGHGASVYVSAGTANRINTSVALNDSTAVVVGSGKLLTVSGNVVNGNNGSEVLTLNGTGTLALTGNNTYGPGSGSTGTRLNGGILQVGGNTALAAGDVNFAGNGTLQAGAGTLSVNNNVDVSPGVTATVDTAGNSLTLNGLVSDSGSLTKIGNGTLAFPDNQANTYTGATTVNGGVLSVTYEGNVYQSTSIVLNGGDLLGNGQSDQGYTVLIDPPIGIGPTNGNVGGTALLDATSGSTLQLNNIITSAGNTGVNNLVVNSGAGNGGTVYVVDGNTFNGTTVISNGLLWVSASTALAYSTLDYSNQGGYMVIDGGIYGVTLGGLAGAQNLPLTNNAAHGLSLTVGNNNGSTTYSGNLSDPVGNGGLTKVGSGTLTLTGTNSYVLPTTISAGVLRINTNGVLDTVSASVPSVAGAQLVVSGGTLVVTNTSNIGTPSAGLLVSSGSATFLGPLTTTLGSNNGNLVAVTGGSLSVSNLSLGRTALSDTTQPTAGSTTAGLYVNGGAMNIVANLDMGINTAANSSVNTRIDSGSLTVGGVVTIGLNNGSRWSVVDVNGGSLTVTNTTTGISVGGPLSGNAELLVRAGTATAGMISMGQTASGSTNMTAVVNLTGGSLYLGSGGITQVSTGALFNSSITLNGGTLGAIANWSSTNNMVLGAAVIQTADTNGNPWNIALSGVLSGTKLNKTGAGTLTLSGPNTYNGATTISNGMLALVAPGLITNTPQISIAAGATFDVSALSGYTFTGANPVQTLAGISTNGAGTVNVTGNALTLAPGAKVLLAAAGGASPTLGKISVTGDLLFAANNPVTINVGGGILGAGNYRLLDCTGNLSGSATNTPAFTGLGATPGAAVSISTTGGAAGHVDLSVGKGTLALQTATATSILLGQALSNATLTVTYTNAAGGAVPGTAVFTSPGTVPLAPGTAAYQVLFTPTDTTDYNTPAPINVNVTVISPVLIPTQSAGITSFNMAGGNVVINGTNGEQNGVYYLLETTNVADPVSIWKAVATNIVSTNGPSGAFTFTGTNTVSSGGAQQFYILSNTNN